MTHTEDISVNSQSGNDAEWSIEIACNTADESPLVSIIIPVYNVRSYIEEAFDSLVSQTYRNLEIIAVDDGSDDGSGEICDKYARADSRFRVIHQTNLGVSSARNNALDVMTGSLVAFLDADDAFYPDMIERMVRAIDDEHVDIAVCCFGVYATEERMDKSDYVEIPGVYELRISGTQRREVALRALADGDMNVAVFNKLYKSSLWEGLRFPELHVAEDMALMFQVINRVGKITVLREKLYRYRNHRNSTSKINSENSVMDYFLAYTSFRSFIEANIPEVFSEDSLESFKRRCLKAILPKYALLDASSDSSEVFAMRNKILLQMGMDTDISKCDWRTRNAWWLFVNCPRLLRSGYRIYHPVRELWKKLVH